MTFSLIFGNTFSQNADIDLLRKINKNRIKSFDNELQFFNLSSDYVAIGNPVILLTAGLIKNDASLKKEGINAALTTIGTYGAGYILKKSIGRSRPYDVYPDIDNYVIENTFSFPSGGSSLAFSTATTLSLSYPKWYVIVPAATYAGIVGYSRLHLGVHYPSDVLAGAILGSGTAVISRYLNKWVTNKVRKKRLSMN